VKRLEALVHGSSREDGGQISCISRVVIYGAILLHAALQLSSTSYTWSSRIGRDGSATRHV